MKKLFLYLAVLMLVTSCSPIKRITRLTEKHPELIPVKEKFIRDSVYIEKEKIREVKVPVKGDTTYIDVPIDCPDQDITLFENSKLKQTIKILNGRLTSITEQKKDTVYVHVKDTEKVTSMNKDEKLIVPTKFIPKFYKYTFWGFWGLLVIIILSLYFRFRKG